MVFLGTPKGGMVTNQKLAKSLKRGMVNSPPITDSFEVDHWSFTLLASLANLVVLWRSDFQIK